jgi:hypothetical protein
MKLKRRLELRIPRNRNAYDGAVTIRMTRADMRLLARFRGHLGMRTNSAALRRALEIAASQIGVSA